MPVPTLQAQESRDCLYRNTASYDSAVRKQETRHHEYCEKAPGASLGVAQSGDGICQIGPTTLWTLMRDKKIIAKKLNDKVLIDLDSIDALYDSLPDAS
jgi:hypothetical protein